jgi:hypothetical protein
MSNIERIFLPAELELVLGFQCSQSNQRRATYCLKCLLVAHREQIVEKYGAERYDELFRRYSMDFREQEQNRLARRIRHNRRHDERDEREGNSQ